jgi:hypothetical protein
MAANPMDKFGCRTVVCPIRADDDCPPSTNGSLPGLSGVVRNSKRLILMLLPDWESSGNLAGSSDLRTNGSVR